MSACLRCIQCGEEFKADHLPLGAANRCSYHAKRPLCIGRTAEAAGTPQAASTPESASRAGENGREAAVWRFPCCGATVTVPVWSAAPDFQPDASPGCTQATHLLRIEEAGIEEPRGEEARIEDRAPAETGIEKFASPVAPLVDAPFNAPFNASVDSPADQPGSAVRSADSFTEPPFEAYEGEAPYVFVSYAHGDAAHVYRDLRWLHEQGWRVWYDEGIHPGNLWQDEIAEAVERAALLIFFVSPRSAASRHCRNEVNYALNEDKPFLAVHLEETELPKGLKMYLGSLQAILKPQLSRESYYRKLEQTMRRYLGEPDRGKPAWSSLLEN